MKLLPAPEPIEKVALELAEEIAVELDAFEENPSLNATLLYKAIHTARNAECRKNHPNWEADVRLAHLAIR